MTFNIGSIILYLRFVAGFLFIAVCRNSAVSRYSCFLHFVVSLLCTVVPLTHKAKSGSLASTQQRFFPRLLLKDKKIRLLANG